LSFQHNHRNLTGHLRLMIGKKWVQFNYPDPQPLSLPYSDSYHTSETRSN
jgi:hypothetical protein